MMDGDTAVLPDSHTDDAGAAVIDVDPGGVPAEARDSQPAEQKTDQPDDVPGSADRASRQGRRSLKLVLTLAPLDDAGFRCLLAVGADDCDPVLRSVEVADLSAALQEAASLVVAAEEHWHSQPRNPASVKKAGGASAKRSGAKQQSLEAGPQDPGSGAPDAEQAQPGQLPLFG